MLLNPDTQFGDRFEALVTDFLSGAHISQLNPEDSSMFKLPTDNDAENPTDNI